MLSFAGPRLVGLEVGPTSLFSKALIFSLFIPLVRYFIPFGLHSLVLMVVFIFYLQNLYNIKFNLSALAGIISMSLLILGDGIIVPPLLKALGLSRVNSIWNDPIRHIALGYLSSSFLIIGCIAALLGFRLAQVQQNQGVSK